MYDKVKKELKVAFTAQIKTFVMFLHVALTSNPHHDKPRHNLKIKCLIDIFDVFAQSITNVFHKGVVFLWSTIKQTIAELCYYPTIKKTGVAIYISVE